MEKFLRRTSLDVIPQLLNVVGGEMSIVGPRPPIPFEYDLYDDRARPRLTVKQRYQLSARSRVPFSQMLAIELDHIRRRSLRLDVLILGKTAVVMLTGKGAA